MFWSQFSRANPEFSRSYKCVPMLGSITLCLAKLPESQRLYLKKLIFRYHIYRFHKIFRVPYSVLHTIISCTSTALRMAALPSIRHAKKCNLTHDSACRKAWNKRQFPWPNSACLWHFVLPRKPVTTNFKLLEVVCYKLLISNVFDMALVCMYHVKSLT